VFIAQSLDQTTKKEPSVGIFWLVGGSLIIDSTPLSEAEQYGDHLTQPRSHLEVWNTVPTARHCAGRH
jgi:hypothetical protein